MTKNAISVDSLGLAGKRFVEQSCLSGFWRPMEKEALPCEDGLAKSAHFFCSADEHVSPGVVNALAPAISEFL
jgi:hypothetical protein